MRRSDPFSICPHSSQAHTRIGSILPARARVGLTVFLAWIAALLIPASVMAQTSSVPPSSVDIGSVQLIVEGPGSLTAESLADAYASAIATIADESAALFAVPLAQPVAITFVAATDPRTTATMRAVRDVAWVDPGGRFALVLKDRFTQLTPVEAENVLRNIISRVSIQAAAEGNLPYGLMDGIARYLERPLLADQARLGSLVQSADQRGTIPDLQSILNVGPPEIDPETAIATQYAFTAFVIGRYGIGALQQLVKAFAMPGATWDHALTTALGQPVADVQTAWSAFLPRWFASGWQTNAIAAFDLAPAQDLFDRGAYAAAADRARLSQQLFADLFDQEQLARVETLLALCSVGLQAETLMTDAQAALQAHDYTRAQSLLTQADQQYALLPDQHRPTDVLQTYHQHVEDGLAASIQLAQATVSSQEWLNLRSSRADALAAGKTFAQLGDVDRAADARSLLSDVDGRVRRMALTLATLAILLTTWFGIWMRSRAPLRFVWSR